MIRTVLLSTAAALLAVVPAIAQEGAGDAGEARARRILERTPLIDGHNDLPWALRQGHSSDPFAVDLTTNLDESTELHTDIPRLRAGGVGGQFWSVYVPASLSPADAAVATWEQIDIVHRLVAAHPDVFELATTADDVVRIHRRGRIASLMGIEGGYSIDDSLGLLREFHEAGVRYMTLTHSRTTTWADSATDAPKWGGLSPFGEQVVKEMNRLGMMVDLSHVSEETMLDAMRVSEAPVIFSHSSAKAICNVPRNVPDDVLRLLPRNGGVVMVTFVPGFISQAVADWNQLESAQLSLLRAEFPSNTAYVNAGMERWRAEHPAPRATLQQVADHIDHIRKVAGIDHIGLGGDFDGITQVVQGLEDVSKYPDLTAELLARGYKDDEVKKVLGLNVLRAWRQAEQAAARLQKTRGPSTVTMGTGDQ